MKIDELICSLADTATGTGIMKAYRELMMNMSLSQEEMEKIKLTKLKRLLEHCEKNVPYYRELFQKSGLTSADLNSFDDLKKFPYLERSIVSKRSKDLIARGYDRERMRKASTGGTSGRSVSFFLDRRTIDYHTAASLRNLRWFDRGFFDRNILLWSSPPEETGYLSMTSRIKSFLLRRRFLHSFQMDERAAQRYATIIQRFRPAIIYGYSSALFEVAKHLRFSSAQEAPKCIIASAEPLFDYQRNYIEEKFNSQVFARYGCNEFSSIAHECRMKKLHIHEDRLIVEFIPIESPNFPEGKIGEVIITDLDNFGMPFVRYRIGDIAEYGSAGCSCGLPFRTFSRVSGRMGDIVSIGDGKAVTPHFWASLLSKKHMIGSFQIIVMHDHLRILIQSDDFDMRAVADELQSFFGDRLSFEIDAVRTIPKTASGKILPVRTATGTEP